MICNVRTLSALLFFVLVAQVTVAQEKTSAHLITLDQFIGYPVDGFILLHIAKKEDYEAGHIPGAINVTRDDISDTTQAFGGLMGSKAQLESLMGRLGILPTDKVVLYDDKGGCDATRLWWLLRYYGHNTTVLLDGGLQVWKDNHQKISKGEPLLSPTEYTFLESGNTDLYANIEDVQAIIDDTNAILLDVRSLSEFNGDTQKKGAFRKGRIPTSILLDWGTLVKLSGNKTLKDRTEIQKVFTSLGITKDKRIVVYCQSGVRSSHTTFVLTEILGYNDVRNYDGSWIEWSFNQNLPIESGPIPSEKEKEEAPSSDYWWLLIIPIAAGLFFLNRRNLRR